MKIAVVTQGAGVGGVERVVEVLVQALGHDHEVRAYAFVLRKHYRDAPDPLFCGTVLNRDGSRSLLRQSHALRRELARWRPDAVIAMKTLPMLLTPVFAPSKAIRVGCEHLGAGWPSGRGWRHRIRGRLRRLVFPRLDGVAALTPEAADALLEIGVRTVSQIDNPVASQFYEIGADPTQKEQVVLVASRLVDGKGVLETIEAWKQLHHQYPGWRLVIAGGGDLLTRAAIAAGSLCAPQGSIALLGDIEEVVTLFSRAQILLSASEYEVQPMSVREAMAAGVAVVTSRNSRFIVDSVESTGAGFVFAPGNVSDLVRTLGEAMGNPELRNSYAARGVSIARAWAPSTVARRWVDFIDLSRHPRGHGVGAERG